MFLTYRYRVRDRRKSDRAALRAQARSVNFVWNYCCEIQRQAERRWAAGAVSKWPTFFDLNNLTAHCAADLGLHCETIVAVCRAFTVARDGLKKHPGWRSGRKSLDWIPINHARRPSVVRLVDGGAVFRKRRYRLWWSRDLPADAQLRTATFAADARGRWYFNATLETGEVREHGCGDVGIDLGLLAVATLSTGETVANPRHTARYAHALAVAQRSRNKHRMRAVHAKIANSRRDHLHKASTAIMRANRRVIVGNVSPSRLKKTRFAKSVSDAGWTTFREMLRYKALRHGVEYQEVSEAYSSRTCSACGVIPASAPKGVSSLGIRRWKCSERVIATHFRLDCVMKLDAELEPVHAPLALGETECRADRLADLTGAAQGLAAGDAGEFEAAHTGVLNHAS